jgi:predicted amidohydrolase YtcJ
MGLLALGGAANALPEVYGYWGELMGAAKARELGAWARRRPLRRRRAGRPDRHVSESYLDGDPGACGHGYVTAEQVREHLVDCARHGVQGGFHAIGDAAIGSVLEASPGRRRGGAGAAAGRPAPVEHAEIMNRAMIKGFVEYGVIASMQPAFDRLWGGATRCTTETGPGPFARLEPDRRDGRGGRGARLRLRLAVTPLDPWGTVRAAMCHHNPSQRINVRTAFAAHTRGGWRAVHDDDEGILAPGASATFAVWAPTDGSTVCPSWWRPVRTRTSPRFRPAVAPCCAARPSSMRTTCRSPS